VARRNALEPLRGRLIAGGRTEKTGFPVLDGGNTLHTSFIGVERIDDLISGKLRHIRIKAEYLDKPVFLGSKEKGEGLVDKAMNSQALTA
jgi:hypothetical protein